jgi:ABC-type dipeptide/oligopeptide/nickel transport system ATPase component
MKKLVAERGVGVLLIRHDIGIVADRVAVVHAGRVVEIAPVDDLFRAPRGPSTTLLLASVPGVIGGTGAPGFSVLTTAAGRKSATGLRLERQRDEPRREGCIE